jgi:hypothetical protein
MSVGSVQWKWGIEMRVLYCVVIFLGIGALSPVHAEETGIQVAEAALKQLAACKDSTEFCMVIGNTLLPVDEPILVQPGDPGDGEPLVRLTLKNWKTTCAGTLGEVFKRGQLYAPPFCVERARGEIRCSLMTATSIPRVVVFHRHSKGGVELRSVDWPLDEIGPGD